MSGVTPCKSERIGREVGAWSCVLSGAVLVAMVAMVPAWWDVGRLEAQRQVLAAQVRGLQWQQQNHELMYNALFTDDPVVLEYLAYHYLGLKPLDAGMVRESVEPQDGRFMSVEHWLYRPLLGIEGQTYEATGDQGRVIAMTMGGPGVGLLVVAGGCLGLGFYLSAGVRHRQGQMPADH